MKPMFPTRRRFELNTRQKEGAWSFHPYQILLTGAPSTAGVMWQVSLIGITTVGLPFMVVVGHSWISSLLVTLALALGLPLETTSSLLLLRGVHYLFTGVLIWFAWRLGKRIYGRNLKYGNWTEIEIGLEDLRVRTNRFRPGTEKAAEKTELVERRWVLRTLQTELGAAIELQGEGANTDLVIEPGPEELRIAGLQCGRDKLVYLYDFLLQRIAQEVETHGLGPDEVPEELEELQAEAQGAAPDV